MVRFVAMAVRDSSEHVPCAHSPVSHLSMVLGTERSVPTTKDKSAAGFIHAASGDVRRPLTDSVHDDDKENLENG